MSWRDETGTLKFRGRLSALTFLGAFTSEEWWEEEEERVRRGEGREGKGLPHTQISLIWSSDPNHLSETFLQHGSLIQAPLVLLRYSLFIITCELVVPRDVDSRLLIRQHN